MNQTLFVRAAFAFGLASQLSCSGDAATAPVATEKLTVTATTRAQLPGEVVPSIRVTAEAGKITFKATRPGSCVMIVDASLSRLPHDLAIVARVWADPLGDCYIPPAPQVLDYSGTISVFESGPYRVRVFDASGGEPLRLIGSAGVKVPVH